MQSLFNFLTNFMYKKNETVPLRRTISLIHPSTSGGAYDQPPEDFLGARRIHAARRRLMYNSSLSLHAIDAFVLSHFPSYELRRPAPTPCRP